MDFFGKLYESGEDLESSPQNIVSTFVVGGEADQDGASELLALAAGSGFNDACELLRIYEEV
jgi:hypothetical protein